MINLGILEEKQKEMTALRDSLVAQTREAGKPAIKQAFGELFKQYPQITAVTWTQYIPGFNDGDPCVFRLGSVGFTIEGAKLTEEDKEDEDAPAGLCTYTLKRLEEEGKIDKGLTAVARDVESKIDSMEDIMEIVFGNDVKVTVTPDEVSIEDYYCEY